MCRNQLGRRNITREQRDYLLSQEYEAQCKTVGGDGSNQYEKKEQLDGNHQIAKGDTRAAIAKSIISHKRESICEDGKLVKTVNFVRVGRKEANTTFGRRNITDEQKTALIGEAYKAQKMTVGAQIGNENAKKQSDQSGHIVSVRTRKEIADKFSVGEGTVQRAENFVDGLNEADKVSPGIKEAVLSDSVKESKKFFIFARLLRDSIGGWK